MSETLDRTKVFGINLTVLTDIEYVEEHIDLPFHDVAGVTRFAEMMRESGLVHGFPLIDHDLDGVIERRHIAQRPADRLDLLEPLRGPLSHSIPAQVARASRDDEQRRQRRPRNHGIVRRGRILVAVDQIHAVESRDGRRAGQAYPHDAQIDVHAYHAIPIRVEGQRHEFLLRLDAALKEMHLVQHVGQLPRVFLEQQLDRLVHLVTQMFSLGRRLGLFGEQQSQHILVVPQQVSEAFEALLHGQFEILEGILDRDQFLHAGVRKDLVGRARHEGIDDGFVDPQTTIERIARVAQHLLDEDQLERFADVFHADGVIVVDD
mmetsp:Transcript_14070/g.41245  ORF Transcript_14070/g.41245 Transcript_14070/m.41245 type:complete len:320 (-) Transcript_14070:235-1194(-)